MIDEPSSAAGFLVVFSDVRTEHDEDYFAWLTTEHVQERLGIEGFLSVRVFRMPIEDGGRYFIWYTLENADVVDSAAYHERLNNPSPWSRRIMPRLGNFARGGGSVAASVGDGEGKHVATIRFQNATANIVATLPALVADNGVDCVHLLQTDRAKSAIDTFEKGLRADESSFATLLMIEAADRHALDAAMKSASQLPDVSQTSSSFGPFEEVFTLHTAKLTERSA